MQYIKTQTIYCIGIQKYLKQAIQFAGAKFAIKIFIDLIVYLLSLLQFLSQFQCQFKLQSSHIP
ncbi:unnamed protein product [Paramecium primaurelia]|uniref:Transmembrane protein n=1 Tax=Paramecium primaurelia TaxID=5886 RepID=A0A8S1KEE9_PARPR|nr:unnamed protein product [Paramecium primaurelia]